MTKRFFTVAIAGIALMLSTSLVIAADESPDDLLRLLKLRLGTDDVPTPWQTRRRPRN